MDDNSSGIDLPHEYSLTEEYFEHLIYHAKAAKHYDESLFNENPYQNLIESLEQPIETSHLPSFTETPYDGASLISRLSQEDRTSSDNNILAKHGIRNPRREGLINHLEDLANSLEKEDNVEGSTNTLEAKFTANMLQEIKESYEQKSSI